MKGLLNKSLNVMQDIAAIKRIAASEEMRQQLIDKYNNNKIAVFNHSEIIFK